MINLPHDAADLMLAPVVLGLNANLERLGKLSIHELATEVALVSNVPDWTRGLREQGLIRAISDGVECHGWDLSFEQRGLCVSHDRREIVLGLPAQCAAYLAGDHRAVQTH